MPRVDRVAEELTLSTPVAHRWTPANGRGHVSMKLQLMSLEKGDSSSASADESCRWDDEPWGCAGRSFTLGTCKSLMSEELFQCSETEIVTRLVRLVSAPRIHGDAADGELESRWHETVTVGQVYPERKARYCRPTKAAAS